MKRIYIVVLIVLGAMVLEACSDRLCPAYSTYPEYRKKGRR